MLVVLAYSSLLAVILLLCHHPSCLCSNPESVAGLVLIAPALSADSKGFLARVDFGQVRPAVLWQGTSVSNAAKVTTHSLALSYP